MPSKTKFCEFAQNHDNCLGGYSFKSIGATTDLARHLKATSKIFHLEGVTFLYIILSRQRHWPKRDQNVYLFEHINTHQQKGFFHRAGSLPGHILVNISGTKDRLPEPGICRESSFESSSVAWTCLTLSFWNFAGVFGVAIQTNCNGTFSFKTTISMLNQVVKICFHGKFRALPITEM